MRQEFPLGEKMRKQYRPRVENAKAQAASYMKRERARGAFEETNVYGAQRQYGFAAKTRFDANTRDFERPQGAYAGAVELHEKRRPLPPVFLALLLVGVVLIMALIISISEIFETTNRISGLEASISELEKTADVLTLELDEKNDIKLIEQIAVEQLGMTKEDSLQRRFVNLSDGEHIELLDAGEEENSVGGVLLSAFFSSLEDFFAGND